MKRGENGEEKRKVGRAAVLYFFLSHTQTRSLSLSRTHTHTHTHSLSLSLHLQEGHINALAFSGSGMVLAVGVGQEHRFGRWDVIKPARNGAQLIALKRKEVLGGSDEEDQHEFVVDVDGEESD